MNKYRLAPFLGFLMVLVAHQARAVPLTFQFVITVTQIVNDDLGFGITLGSTVSGSYTFESETVDANPAPLQANYEAPFLQAQLTLGTSLLQIAPSANSGMITLENASTDNYSVDVVGSSASQTEFPYSIYVNLNLNDTTAMMLTSDALPIVPPGIPLCATCSHSSVIQINQRTPGLIETTLLGEIVVLALEEPISTQSTTWSRLKAVQ